MVGRGTRHVAEDGLRDGQVLLGELQIVEDHLIEGIHRAARQRRDGRFGVALGEVLAAVLLDDVVERVGAQVVRLGHQLVDALGSQPLHLFGIFDGCVARVDRGVETLVGLAQQTAEIAVVTHQAAPVAVAARRVGILPDVGTALGVDDERILGLTVDDADQIEIAVVHQLLVAGRGPPLLVRGDGRRIHLIQFAPPGTEQQQGRRYEFERFHVFSVVLE